VESAFRRFTAQFADWWPRSTHSIGGKLVKQIVFECRDGGQIIEELVDGRRYQWGRVTLWEPPHRVGFTWHPSQNESEAQDVVISFRPDGTGTMVELVSTGWERMAGNARRARKGYGIGWGSVLSVFAGQRSGAIVLFAIISGVATLILRITGKLERAINDAGGRLPPAE
jgi:uncharacterized protein YndB with AHSA1/START domain